VFPVRYELSFYILATRRLVFEGLRFIQCISVTFCKRAKYANVSSTNTAAFYATIQNIVAGCTHGRFPPWRFGNWSCYWIRAR
jgi:predicted membrane-bound spermidine synthase